MLDLLILFLCLAQGPPASARLAVIQKTADFALVDQAGKAVRLTDFKGQVVLVGFVFTTCNGSCPATTHRMVMVQEELKRRGRWNKDIRLVSITLDPARDTPEKLQAYMRLYDIDPAGWSFLTGPAEKVNAVIAAWDMWARPAANGQLDHPSRIFLVDHQGQVREIYNLDFFRVPWVVEDIELLLRSGGEVKRGQLCTD
jgi:protein SCO1/2